MASSKNVVDLTDASFDAEVLKSDIPVLIDFTASWCGPCKLLAPIVDKLADELVGKIKVAKLDIDAAGATAAKYGVRAVPTVMVFSGGQRKAVHTGLATREKLVAMLDL